MIQKTTGPTTRPLRQVDIAEAMGASQPNVSAWLSGAKIPTAPTVERLARAMGREPSDLIAEIYRRRAERLAPRTWQIYTGSI